MEILELGIEGVILIKPRVFPDNRGYFYESFNIKKWNNFMTPVDFVQDNLAYNKKKNTIRGMHYQEKSFQAKLVSCIKGSILDVVVDVRPSSKTYGKWISVELSDANNYQLWIPKGFAHGYRTLSDDTIVIYKADDFYRPDDYRGFIWNDKGVNIDWGLTEDDEVILSKQDISYKSFSKIGKKE